jgi:chemotaxis protein MotB
MRITLNDLMKQLRYESGEATIKTEGYQVLDELIEYLKGAPADQLIRVEGHADNMEIGPTLKSRYPTNWDLSKARASGVLRYLIEKGGIDSARISSVGYGDTKPVVSNATEPGRQRNRRVDIVLYSPESDQSRSEQTMKSAPTDEGYKVSGLAEGQGAAVLSGEQAPASPAKTMIDEPASTRTDQVPTPSSPAASATQPGGDPHADEAVTPLK